MGEYRGVVMVPNVETSEGSHHRWSHWQLDECGPLGCTARDTEGPDGDSPVAADGVVIEQALSARGAE